MHHISLFFLASEAINVAARMKVLAFRVTMIFCTPQCSNNAPCSNTPALDCSI